MSVIQYRPRAKCSFLKILVEPLFRRDAKEFVDLAAEGLKSGTHPDFFEYFHNTIAETTLILLLGQASFCSSSPLSDRLD